MVDYCTYTHESVERCFIPVEVEGGNSFRDTWSPETERRREERVCAPADPTTNNPRGGENHIMNRKSFKVFLPHFPIFSKLYEIPSCVIGGHISTITHHGS